MPGSTSVSVTGPGVSACRGPSWPVDKWTLSDVKSVWGRNVKVSRTRQPKEVRHGHLARNKVTVVVARDGRSERVCTPRTRAAGVLRRIRTYVFRCYSVDQNIRRTSTWTGFAAGLAGTGSASVCGPVSSAFRLAFCRRVAQRGPCLSGYVSAACVTVH